MRRFEITEIANDWLISYHTDYGYVQRFFSDVEDIVEILKSVTASSDYAISDGRMKHETK